MQKDFCLLRATVVFFVVVDEISSLLVVLSV